MGKAEKVPVKLPEGSEPKAIASMDAILEEFLAQHRRGENPDIEEYASRFPGLARELRSALPALVMLEDFGPENESAPGSTAPPLKPLPTQQVGNYRILREIGRGGMGVVYEAEQISLGRRVALKVLPGRASIDEKRLPRFQREARAAARLHHPNIVPVFEVGQEGEHTFYAMQLIEGRSLDLVIEELKQLKEAPCTAGRGSEKTDPSSDRAALHESSLLLISSLLRSEFPPSDPTARNETGLSDQDSAGFDRREDSRELAQSLSEIFAEGSRNRRYYHSLAKLALQAAEALAYAHDRGIIHRDVKPSNLIIDASGALWLTDFGLAKTEEEGLTRTGDVLGTVRYMSPERFEGSCDARADIYSLGLTLYELLTLSPAFYGWDRIRLIHTIAETEPIRPRAINPHVPADLETICLKCTEKAPNQRYATAKEVVEDLSRFIRGEPILARPINVFERGIRWIQRNPGRMALIVAIMVALCAVGGAIAGWMYQSSLSESKQNLEAALQRETRLNSDLRAALEKAEEAQKAEARSRENLEQILYFRRISLAHLEWNEGNVAQARRLLQACPPDRRHWEWHYLQHLCHPEEQVHRLHKDRVRKVLFSPNGQQLATASQDGAIRILSPQNGQELMAALVGQEKAVRDIAYSPDGRYLASGSADWTLRVYDLRQGKAIWSNKGHRSQISAVAFSPDGNHIATGGYRNVMIWDLSTKKCIGSWKAHQSGVNAMQFSPDGSHLLTAGYDRRAKIWTLPGHRLLASWKGSSAVLDAAFSPDGKTFALSEFGRSVRLVQTETCKELAHLSGHTKQVHGIAFRPDGNALVSCCEDGSIRLWSTKTGKLLQVIHGHVGPVISVAYSPDGKKIVSGGADHAVRFWDHEDLINRGAIPEQAGKLRGMAISPNGMYFAYSRSNRAIIRDRRTREKIFELPEQSKGIRSLRFSPDSRTLAVGGVEKIKLWSTRTGKLLHSLTGHGTGISGLSFSPNGKELATAGGTTIHKWDVTSGKSLLRIQAHNHTVSDLSFVNKGRQLVSASYDRLLKVWDAGTGKLLKELKGHTALILQTALSPDKKRLATGSAEGRILLWNTETWEVEQEMHSHPGGVVGLAFTPDSKRLLSAGSDETVRIWELPSGELAFVLRRHLTSLGGFALTPDGKRLLRVEAGDRIVEWQAPGFSVLDP